MEQVKELYARGCAICGRLDSLHIDHNHRTGKVREALCRYCNTGIGMFKENFEFLRKAVSYIARHEDIGC